MDDQENRLTPGRRSGYNEGPMNSLKVGDKVIYPNQGLGIVEDITGRLLQRGEVQDLPCPDRQQQHPRPGPLLDRREEMGIRRPISEGAIKKIFQFMRSGTVDLSMNWKGRYKEHINLMKSGTLLDMALVLKSLFYLSLLKPLSFREKKMMERAKELIVSEISEASCESLTRIERRLLETLSRCFKDNKPRLDV